MKSHHQLTMALAAVPIMGLGCAGTPSEDEPGQRFDIRVAPLDGGISDACYKVEVFATDSPGAFDDDPLSPGYNLVWQEDELCSSSNPAATNYGRNGELRYTGICRDYEADTNGSPNAVRLTIGELGAGATDLLATGFINPCPAATNLTDDNGCVIVADCKTNADTQVEFDLTVMRQASYGFFDVAVRFNEIFCAAKVDCTEDDAPTTTLKFLQKPDGTDGDTVVLGFACFGGTETPYVYLDDITIACPDGAGGTDVATVLVGSGPGRLAATDFNTLPDTSPEILFGAAVNQGAAMEGGIYLNVLLGMNRYASCALTAQGTASPTSLGGAPPYSTPPDTNYPYIDFNVTLGDAAGRTCTKHPLFGTGSSAGVSAPYTGVDDPVGFDNELAPETSSAPPACPCWAPGTPGAQSLARLDAMMAGSPQTYSSSVGREQQANSYDYSHISAQTIDGTSQVWLVGGFGARDNAMGPTCMVYDQQGETETMAWGENVTSAQAEICRNDIESRFPPGTCFSDTDCTPGETCDLGTHACVAPEPASDLCPAGTSEDGQIAMWSGKVNVHLDSQQGWVVDADCSSGAQIAPLTYCQKFHASTVAVAMTVSSEAKPFTAAGGTAPTCGGVYAGPGQSQYRCCSP